MKQQMMYWLHAAEIPLGGFICIGGTYGAIMQIITAYNDGQFGKLTMPTGLASTDVLDQVLPSRAPTTPVWVIEHGPLQMVNEDCLEEKKNEEVSYHFACLSSFPDDSASLLDHALATGHLPGRP